MPTYVYTKSTGKPLRTGGRYVTYSIYKMIRNKPKLLGIHRANIASYRGDRGEVTVFIGKKEGYKTDGYHFKRKDIKLYEV